MVMVMSPGVAYDSLAPGGCVHLYFINVIDSETGDDDIFTGSLDGTLKIFNCTATLL